MKLSIFIVAMTTSLALAASTWDERGIARGQGIEWKIRDLRGW